MSGALPKQTVLQSAAAEIFLELIISVWDGNVKIGGQQEVRHIAGDHGRGALRETSMLDS